MGGGSGGFGWVGTGEQVYPGIFDHDEDCVVIVL
jgi:hypothetical protein